MSEFMRTLLLLAIAGAGATLAGSTALWLRDQDARLRRCLRKGLGAPPDALIVGAGAGAAISLEAGLCVIAWAGGAWRIAYPLSELRGGELIIDGVVAARIMPGEPRRAMERVVSSAELVTLRLIFDDPARPRFDIELWTPAENTRRVPASPAAAIEAGGEWLARIDALSRRPARVATPVREEMDVEKDDPPF